LRDKAYKLLAKQKNISNSKAKDLIDKGLVTINGKRVMIARGEVDIDTIFKVDNIESIEVIFEDDDILVVDKPPYINSEDIANSFDDATLLNRLDKETSGVMLFAKNEAFRTKAIEEFRANRVYKEYSAIVSGKVVDEMMIDKPIHTIKGKFAKSKIDIAKGKPAKTTIYPMFIEGRHSKVKVVIENGRTHQIRVHLSSLGYPIIGDTIYGKPSSKARRVLLHSHKTKIFDYEFISKDPKEYKAFGF
jgi:23S rRNA pseudouridine1911/1915/1917 synthase